MNNLFIQLVLIIVYTFVFGFVSIIYRLLNIKKEKKNTYWQDAQIEKSEINYFQSPY